LSEPSLFVEENIFVNGIPALYEKLSKENQTKLKELIKQYLLSTFNSDVDKKADRWLEIPGGMKPTDHEYFKLYWELIQLYTNGLFYSTVVLGGILSERLCYDILAKQRITLKEKGELTKDQISCLFKLNLKDIIDVLTKWNLIKDETRTLMLQINDKRNSYVHPTKTGRVDEKKDSKEIINKISKLIANEFPVEKMG
jgi:hypothetical protein